MSRDVMSSMTITLVNTIWVNQNDFVTHCNIKFQENKYLKKGAIS